jgi:hypothetical protein
MTPQRFAVLLCALTLLSGCAGQPRKPGQPVWPQAIISAEKSELRELFLGTLAAEGAAIDKSGESMIEVRIPDSNATLNRALFGCPACANPYIKTHVIFSTVPTGTQVVVQYWRMVPKFSGTEERMEINSQADYQQWQQILNGLRERYATSSGVAGQ